jgi:hypothetical protein
VLLCCGNAGGMGPAEDFQSTVVMLTDRRAAFDPVAGIDVAEISELGKRCSGGTFLGGA